MNLLSHGKQRGIEEPDRLQRLAQVVARRGEKPSFRIIGPIRLFAGCDQRVVDGSALRHVANGGATNAWSPSMKGARRIPAGNSVRPPGGRINRRSAPPFLDWSDPA